MARAVEIPVVVKKGTLSRSIEGESAAAFKRMGSSSSAVAPLGRMLGKIRSDADEFTKSIEASNARVIAFGASVGVINGISTAFKQLVAVTVSVEKSLTDINVVLNANKANLQKFGDGLFKVAKNTAQSFEVVAEAATEFARQGLSLEETLKRTNDALILTRLTGLKAADSVKGLTAATNGFAKAGLTTTQIINKLAAVDVKFAVSADDLIDALSRTGAVAQDAGLSMDKLIGMVTAAQQTTARGGAVIGNAFKTIFTRVQRPETLKTLRSLRIAVDDVSGAALPADKVLQNLANSYDGLSKSAKDAVNQQVAGVFQINILKAAVGDLQKQNSIAARATQVSASATDQATRKNEQLNTTIAALSTQTGLALTELAKKIGDIALAPGMRDIVSSFKALVEGATKGLDGEGTGSKFAKGLLTGIGNVLTGPGLIVIGGVFIKLFKDLTVFGVKSMKNLLGLNNAAKAQAALQQGIGQLLATNVQYENAMTAAAGNLNKQAAITQTYLAKEITMRQQNLALTGAMAGSAFAGGYRVSAAGEIGKKSRMFGGRGKVPSYAPTEGVPNFARFGYRSPLAVATGDAARAGGTFKIGRSKLAKKMPQAFKRVARDMDLEMSYGDVLGLSAKGQAGMIGGMRGALGAGGYGAFGRGRMVPGVDPGLYGSQSLSGLQSAMRGVSPRARGSFDQKMAEQVTEPYIAAHAQRAGGGSGGIVGLLGGRQGKDTFFDALRLNPDRTYTPVEIKKRLMGEATKATMAKKSLYSETNPALRNEFFRRAESPKELKKMRDHIFSELQKAYDVYARAGIQGFGSHRGSFSQVKAVKKFHKAVNFAPIGDAIQREKMQVGGLLGMNPSQVQTRVVQNTALRSSFNPQGFGVISPTVGQHSFADAARMHKGEDLRTANLPNFALPVAGIDPKRPDLSVTATGYSSAIEAIISGVKDEPAKKLGRATAREIIRETKLAPPPPRARGISIAPGVDTKAASEMARTGGGMGNLAMNAFLAYSAGTMLDPVGKAFGLEGNIAAGATGGYLGGVAGSKIGKRVFTGTGKGGKAGRGASVGLGALAAATASYMGMDFDSLDDFRDYTEGLGEPFATGMTPGGYREKRKEETAAFRSSLDRITRDALEASELQGIDALRLDTALQTRKVRGKEYRSLFNQLSTMEPTREKRERRLENRILSRRIPASGPIPERGFIDPQGQMPRGTLGYDVAPLPPRDSEVLPPYRVSGLTQPRGDFLRRQAEINRRRSLGIFDKGRLEQTQAQLGRERLNASQMLEMEKAQRQRRDQLIKGIGGMPAATGGAEGMIMRNVMLNMINAGRFGELEEMGNLAISGGTPTGTGEPYSEKSAQRDLWLRLEKARKEMSDQGLDPRAGIPQEILQGRDVGFDSKQFTDWFLEFKELNDQSGGFAQNVRDAANSSGELAENFQSARAISEVNEEIDQTNLKLANTNKFIKNFSVSLGEGISQATTGADIGGVLRNLGVSVFGSINQIASQNIANQVMSGLFPQGGKNATWLHGLLGGNQAGGLIQAQNGMYVSGSRTGDKNPAMLEDGEYVLNRNAVKAMGGAGALDSLNFNMAPRFAEGGGFSGFMGSVGKGLMMPFTLIGKLLSSIFGGGKPGKSARFSPATTHAAGTGTSIQAQRQRATTSMQSQAAGIMAELDALTAKGAGQAVSANRDDPKMAGIRRRALESKQRRRLQAYKGIGPGPLGQSGQMISGTWHGGRTHALSDRAASQRLTDLMHKGAAVGGPEALMPMLEEFGRNPGMLDGFTLGGVRFGPDVSMIRKIAALQTEMEKRGIGFQTGGRLVSPIAGSGVSSKGLDKILGKYPVSSPVGGQGVAVGGGGGAGRMGITAANLSGFAHSNDPTLQNVRGDIREWHNEQIQKKFEKQAKRDELMQTIVGAALSAGINQGIGGIKGMMAKGDAYETPTGTPTSGLEEWGGFRDVGRNTKLSRWGRFKSGARGFNPVTGTRFKHMFTTKGVPRGQSGGQIDNIPALLTGGEFVVNAPTVKRYGSGFFQKFQEGGLVGDQKFVPAEQKTAGDSKDRGTQKGGGSNTTINITINSSSGEGSTDTSGEPNTDERQMAVKIRDAVVSVIKQEKRTGGMLRDVTAQDQ